MSSTFDPVNRGNLGANKRRRNDRDPTHAGTINVEGVEYWLNAWVQVNRDSGERFFSLALKRKEPRAAQPEREATPGRQAPPPARAAAPGFDDDIPF